MNYRDAVVMFDNAEDINGFGKALRSADVMVLSQGLKMTTNVVQEALDKMRLECVEIIQYTSVVIDDTTFKFAVYKGDRR